MTVMHFASRIALAALQAALTVYLMRAIEQAIQEYDDHDWMDDVQLNCDCTQFDLSDETYQLAYRLVGK